MPNELVHRASNESSSESLQVANNVAGVEYGVKAALAPIPSMFYPNNPGQQEVIPFGADSAYSYLTKILSLLFSLTNVGNTWESAKRLYYAKNKNLETVLDFSYNFLKTAAWFTFIGLIAAGFFLIAPYLLVGMASLGVAYGIFNIVKHSIEAHRAHKEKDQEKRDEHLKAIPTQILMTAMSTLGLIFSIDVGINLTNEIANAVKLGQEGQLLPALMLMISIGSAFESLKVLFYTVVGCATLGAITSRSTWEMNKETGKFLWQCIMHPMQQLRCIKDAFIEKCKALKEFVGTNPLKGLLAVGIVGFEIIGLVSKAVTRVIALVATPLLVVGVGLRKIGSFCAKKIAAAYRFIFTKKENVNNTSSINATITPSVSTTLSVQEKLTAEYKSACKKVNVQLAHLDSQKKTPKIEAKIAIMKGLQKKLGEDVRTFDTKVTAEDLETDARKISPLVYQSFLRSESKTAEAVRVVSQLDAKVRMAAAA